MQTEMIVPKIEVGCILCGDFSLMTRKEINQVPFAECQHLIPKVSETWTLLFYYTCPECEYKYGIKS